MENWNAKFLNKIMYLKTSDISLNKINQYVYLHLCFQLKLDFPQVGSTVFFFCSKILICERCISTVKK